MKVYVITAKVSKSSNEIYIHDVFARKDKAIAQMNWLNNQYGFFDFEMKEYEVKE